jgi:hypothetical protein
VEDIDGARGGAGSAASGGGLASVMSVTPDDRVTVWVVGGGCRHWRRAPTIE